MKKPFKVPFSRIKAWPGDQEPGSMLDWANAGYGEDKYRNTDKVEWRDPIEFSASLTIADAGRGRSAVVYDLKDSGGRRYIMRLAETLNMMQKAHINRGTVNGRWGFKKQGESYTLVYLGDA